MNLSEGGHKKSCTCGFCQNKGRFGKKDRSKECSAAEKESRKRLAAADVSAENDQVTKAETSESHAGKIVSQLLDENCFCTCRACGAKFDYYREPESGMGYVKCPTCAEPVTQEQCRA